MLRVWILLVAGSVVLALSCSGSKTNQNKEEAGSEKCESAATYQDRWPSFVAGGPSIGPVTIVMAPEVELAPQPESKFKMAILVAPEAAPYGTIVVISSEAKEGRAPLLFSHGLSENDPFLPEVRLIADGRGQFANHPFDIPGSAIPRERGCYQIWVEVDGQSYGPFGWNVI